MLLHALGGRRIRLGEVKGVDQKLLMELPDLGSRGPVAVRVAHRCTRETVDAIRLRFELGTSDKRRLSFAR